MEITDFLMLPGGLALFLYGMKMMSDGLEVAAGNKLKKILEKLTTNRFLGILVGALITAIIQSSSATTVMVVGFVNSGLMQLSQAVWVIMGANIGTTITGQLIALDIGLLAPIIAFIGVVLVVFFKKKKINCIGEIIGGLGILFIGMGLMSDAMIPLRDSPVFIKMMTSFANPLYGILAGALFTGLIQSSSASIGILQALAASGVIGLGNAVYVLFGQNIGTCITAILASIGTNKNARRATIMHFLFNVIGVLIFVPLCMFTPLTRWIASWTPNSTPAQIANMHTVFNITTTLLLLPFGMYLAKLATKLLPGEDDASTPMKLLFVEDHNIGSTAIAISQLYQEIAHMLNLSRDNVKLSFKAILKNTDKDLKIINEQEEYIDYLNTEITRYIYKLSGTNMSVKDSKTINALFKMTGDIERIGDHALNISEHIQTIKSNGLNLSDEALKELREMQAIILDNLNQLTIIDASNLEETLKNITHSEEVIDELNVTFRQNQIDRMKNQECTPEACVIYSELLIDIERISDHLLNIAESLHKAQLALKS